MREIQLTQGKVAQVDDEDFEELNQFKWCAGKYGKMHYAMRQSATLNGKRRIIRMHYAIVGKLPDLEIDHIDGNGLNNQKSNLRFVTHRQNGQNNKNAIKTSQYPGVCLDKRRNKWIAQIQINGANKFLGYFTSEINAFNTYRKAVNVIGEQVISL